MEKQRAPESVGFFAYERPVFRYTRGFSPIFITAALSVVVLLAVTGWEMTRSYDASNVSAPLGADAGGPSIAATGTFPASASASDNTATSTDPLSSLGPNVMSALENAYVQLQAAGQFSTSTATQAGESLAPYITADISYKKFSPSQIKTTTDTSYQGMLKYRSDLRISLAPLLKNTTPEYKLFAEYVQTNDASYLRELQSVANDYRTAASSTALIVVPADALSVHVGILNSMEEFAATLDAMVAHADDPFASTALLQTYNNSEDDVRTSFNALITYEKQKQP